MDSGAYAACAGLTARSQQLDLIAQDLANANTTGYRSQRTAFQTVLAASKSAIPNVWSGRLNAFGVLGKSTLNPAPGNLENTGSPLDLGIEGDAYFAIQTPSGVRYTRNGQFTVSAQGVLVTRDGFPVTGDQGPIHVASGALSISGDGTLSVDGALAGKIALVQFPSTAALQAEGSSYYTTDAAAMPSVHARVRQGALESSNVNPIASAVELVSVQRNAQMLQRALSTFHSDFDRIATQDLPKV